MSKLSSLSNPVLMASIKGKELGKTLIITKNQVLGNNHGSLKMMHYIDIDNELSSPSESRSSDQDLNVEVQFAEARSQLGFISSTSQTDYQIDLSKRLEG